MNWKNILNTKRNESLILTSVILLIVMIGYMNKKQISELKESVTSIYEDRLVAKAYIFDLSQKMSAKKVKLSAEYRFIQESLNENESIDQLIRDYERTRLTLDETALLTRLKDDINLSVEFENQILHNPALPNRSLAISSLNNQYDLILLDLKNLAEIQVHEGKKLLESSNGALAFNGFARQLEIALFIVVGLIFLMIISSPKALIDKDFWSLSEN